jgi:hypothetical protein
MKRILGVRGMVWRSNLSLAILTAVFAYGLWELWVAATVTRSPTGYLFGLIFVGGAVYGLRSALAETRDLVVAFDVDMDSGKAAVTLWRPFRMKRIDTTLDRLTGWRRWIQTASRGRRTYFLLAREVTYDGVLRFTLEPGMTVPDELRRIAPEAIADFERETGRREA